MRKQVFAVFAFLCVFPVVSSAQDPAAQAAQQANQDAIQANQEAIRQAQAANEEAMRQAQLASQEAARQAQQDADDAAHSLQPGPYAVATMQPSISVKSGKYQSPVTVRLKTPTRGAIIYYTTDGWTPTALSNRYTGPITIDATTTLQAIALVPYNSRSLVSVAQYTFPRVSASAPEKSTANVVADATGKYILARDTPVSLVFTSQVTSKSVEVGDKLPLALAEDITLGNVVLAQKGTPVEAVVTDADGSRPAGTPGTITFVVHSFKVSNITVFLRGTATKEGAAKVPNASTIASSIIPVVGEAILLRHGGEAVIPQGMLFTATVYDDVLLPSLFTTEAAVR